MIRFTRIRFVAYAALPALCVLLIAPARSLGGPLDPTWRMLASPKWMANSVLDAAHRRVLVLSDDDYSDCRQTLWSADLDAPTAWAPQRTSGLTPEQAHNFFGIWAPVVDTRRDRMVGWDNSGDVWALDLASLAWSHLGATGSFTMWNGQAVAYDSVGDRVFVMCGQDNGRLGFHAFNEVQVLSLSGTPGWSLLAIDGTPPTGRGFASAVFDARRNRIVMFGGQYVAAGGSMAPLDEVWELSLSGTPTWRFITPVAPVPSPRQGTIALYDSRDDRMLVYGGSGAGSASLGNDLWSLTLADPDTSRWTHLAPTGVEPARQLQTAVLDPVRRTVVLGGGFASDAPTNPPDGSYVTLGGRFELMLTAPPAWSSPAPDRDVPPVPGPMLIDAARDRILTVGEASRVPPFGTAVWAAPVHQPPMWTRLAFGGLLPRYASAIVDAAHDRLVLFGGTRSDILVDDVVTMSLQDGSVAALATTGTPPAARLNHAALYDAAGNQMLVYGGSAASNGSQPYLGDLWALTLGDTPTWSRLDVTGPRPSARALATSVLDSIGRRLVVYGGTDTLGGRQDVWAFSLDSLKWAQLAPNGVAAPNVPGGFGAYDAQRQRALVQRYTSDSAIWSLSLQGSPQWTPVVAQGCGPSLGNWYSAPAFGVFDAARDLLVVSGLYYFRPWQLWALYMQDWITAATASIVSATADAYGSHLVWWSEGVTAAVPIERSIDGGEWVEVATRTPDGTGQLRYDDMSVEPGRRYAYRLRFVESGVTTYLGLASLEIPGRMMLSLVAAPNPGPVPRFVVTLPQQVREARLELFDLVGRRLLVRALSRVDGPLAIAFDSRPALRPGLYLARLVADGRVAARITVIVVK